MKKILVLGLTIAVSLSSCVTKKKYNTLKEQLDVERQNVTTCENASAHLKLDNKNKTELIEDLKAQLADCKQTRDKQLSTVGDLTVLTKEANSKHQGNPGPA